MLRASILALATGCAAHAAAPVVTIAQPLPPPTAQVAAPVELPPPPVPADYVRVSVAGVVESAVVLTDASEEVVVPIYIGGTEAASIHHRYDHTSAIRPLTHDLLDSALHELGARVVRVQVDKLQDNIYFATIVLKQHGRYIQLDARPSDAIAIALGADAPIYCASRVLVAAGVPRDSFEGLPPKH